MTWKFWTWFKKKPVEETVIEDITTEEETATGFSSPKPPLYTRKIQPISKSVAARKASYRSSAAMPEEKTVVVHEHDTSFTDYLLMDAVLNHHEHREDYDNERYGGGSCGGGGSSRSWDDDDDDSKRYSSSYDSSDSYSSSYDSSSSCDCDSSCDSGSSDW